MNRSEFAEVLAEHAVTARRYAARSRIQEDVFLGKSADYWEGAAAVYSMVAALIESEEITE